MKLPVSVIILTKDEEKNLPGCLASVKWAAEVLVVDSQSRDRTVAVARKGGAKVISRPWPGYTAQRNFALSKCRQPWVLSVDADERVSEELRDSIAALLKAGPQKKGYRVPEVNNYFGRWLRYGGIYPGYHMIFYKRQGARYESGQADVHEGVQVEDPGDLDGHLIHHAYPSLELALDKLNFYTSTEASGRLSKGMGSGLYGILFKPLKRFVRNYFFKLGFLDGVQGLLYCFLTGYYTFAFQLKIWAAKERDVEA